MTLSTFLSASAALALACAAFLSAPAQAAGVNGHWASASIDRAADLGPGHIIGLIVPEYGENEFVVFYMYCSPSRRAVIITQDTGDSERPRSRSVPLLIDGKASPMAGRPGFNEMGDSWYLEATVSYGSPTVKAILAAKSLGLAGNPQTQTLPSARYQTAMATWTKACGLR